MILENVSGDFVNYQTSLRKIVTDTMEQCRNLNLVEVEDSVEQRCHLEGQLSQNDFIVDFEKELANCLEIASLEDIAAFQMSL